jgi:hypothetical protein
LVRGNYFGLDPSSDYKERWYKETAPIAHEYVGKAAFISHKYMQFIKDIESDTSWSVRGFFMVLELDLAIKAIAGIIYNFLRDNFGIQEAEFSEVLFGRMV